MSLINFDNTVGAGFLACMISAMLFGITLTQACHYFQTYKTRDGRFTAVIVLILLLADTIHTALTTQAMFIYLIKGFENLVQLDSIPWSLTASTILAVLSDFIVRCYSVRRIWFLSSRNLVVTLSLAALVISTFGIGIYASVEFLSIHRLDEEQRFARVLYILLGSAILSDFAVAAPFCYFLFNSRTGHERTTSAINTILAYTVNTGILTGLWDICGVVVFATTEGTLLFLVFFVSFPKFYINSLLASLNARTFLQIERAPSLARSVQNRSATFDISRPTGKTGGDECNSPNSLEFRQMPKVLEISVSTSVCSEKV